MSKPVAVIVNLTDAQIALPPVAEAANGSAVVHVLGAQVDRGVVGLKQPELPVNAYQLATLQKNKIFQAMRDGGGKLRRQIEIRSPNLDLTLG